MDVEKTIREYIAPLAHMSLATAKNNIPWVCEVHFACDEGLNIYFRSLPSRRHSLEIAGNSHVAGNIVRQHQPGEVPVGVYFEGLAKVLTTGPEQDKAFMALHAKFNLGQEILEEARRADGHKFYKITVNNWYLFGRFDGPSGQKYQLAWNDKQ
jgi:uncharacterized protein YhbP (UPF0306 family)